jgi:hypothetical protein
MGLIGPIYPQPQPIHAHHIIFVSKILNRLPALPNTYAAMRVYMLIIQEARAKLKQLFIIHKTSISILEKGKNILVLQQIFSFVLNKTF